MNGKAFFIDTTLCTGCRGCQIACKQWNQLPATKTENWGSYQNPKDLSFDTYKLIRFQEYMGPDNKPVWYFFQDSCRHCVEPPCKETADDDVPGGIIIDSHSGAVLYTDKLKKAKHQDIIDACPFNKRLAEAKAKFPKAVGTGLDDLRVFHLLADAPEKYYQYASVERAPSLMDRQMALKKIGRSLRELSKEWNILHKLAS